jgi:(R)-amidase
MTMLRLAVAQPTLADGDREANLARIRALVAVHGDAHDILVLPETCTSGFASREDVERLAEPPDGPTLQELRTLAARHDLLIAAGLAERSADGLYNSQFLVDGTGIVGHYRKTHLWLGDHDKFRPGQWLRTCDWRGMRLGQLICFDIEFPDAARALADAGAELILVSNGNMAPYAHVHHTAALARAQDHQVFVAMANRTGPGRVEHFAGGSIVVDPWGRALAEAGTGSCVLSVTIETAAIAEARAAYHYRALRRDDLTTPLHRAAATPPSPPLAPTTPDPESG